MGSRHVRQTMAKQIAKNPTSQMVAGFVFGVCVRQPRVMTPAKRAAYRSAIMAAVLLSVVR